ncbi:MAG: N-acetylglucosamine-6-phosphate deacetylase [Saccharospirillaceae bacterium]|nr:N-acetylglucosamine-6-phosphate deacetylase [Saccharospirillaceae bacterium]
MTQKIISANQIFDGCNIHAQAQLIVEQGKVVAIEAIDGKADEHIDGLITAGFIDLQVNGGGGVLLNTHATVEGIKTIVNAHRQFGTTAMLPTLISDSIAVMSQAANAIALAIVQKVPGVLGIHFEGPHLSVVKKGAHSEEFIRPISDAEWLILSRNDLGQIKVTIAPENVEIKDIKRMVELGIKVFLGHSNAEFSTVQAALDAGADGFTHLFNAMSPFTSRKPGMVGAALLNDQAVCGLIVDGHHVDYASCRLALKTKPKGKVLLVTDAMSVVGSDIKRFAFFDREIIKTGSRLNSSTGELAGSALDMATAVRNTNKYLGQTLIESLKMASLYPAQYLGLADKIGQLQPGAQADFIALNDNLEVIKTWRFSQ